MTKYDKRRRVLLIVFAVCAAIAVVGSGAVLFIVELAFVSGAPDEVINPFDAAAMLFVAPAFAAFCVVVLGDVYIAARYFLGEPEKKRPLFTAMNAYALVCEACAIALFMWDVLDADAVARQFTAFLVLSWMMTANVILRFLYLVLSVSADPKRAESTADGLTALPKGTENG